MENFEKIGVCMTPKRYLKKRNKVPRANKNKIIFQRIEAEEEDLASDAMT